MIFNQKLIFLIEYKVITTTTTMSNILYYLPCFGKGMVSKDTTTQAVSDSNTTTTDKKPEDLLKFLHLSSIFLV
jgi:hypothetical protein